MERRSMLNRGHLRSFLVVACSEGGSMVKTIGTTLEKAAAELRGVSSTPRLDAEMLLPHLLHSSRPRLLARLPERLPDGIDAQFAALIERRQALVPVAYLLRSREF